MIGAGGVPVEVDFPGTAGAPVHILRGSDVVARGFREGPLLWRDFREGPLL